MKTINSLRSKLFALTLALMAGVASFAYDEMPPDFKVDGLYYNFLEGDNVEVTHPYRPALPTESASNAATQDSPDDYANLTELTIPSTVTYEGNVYHVTRIGHHAFDQCENLTSVDIPNSIKSIGIRAFSWCSALTSIVLKGGLENIESYAFEYCLGLENISLPNSLMTIGQNAFYNTQWYKNQPNGGVYVGNVFYKYKGDIPQNTSFVIKEGTVSISPYAFVKENYHEDYSLVSVSIPNSVKVIGEGVFYRCRALTSIVIPDGVITIETLAFHYCKALNSVTCKAVEPPVLGSSVFSVVPLTDATLYVPAESVDAYKNADQWKDFGQILPIEPTSYKSQWCDTWNMLVRTGSIYPPSSTPYRYQLAKDTVIGDYTYTAVVSKAINDALDAPHYVAAVRFTDDRKVYIYYDNAEYLLYDFNVQEGDELEVFAGINNYTSEIKTYKCTVTGVEQYACIGCPATITLQVHNHPNDFREFYRETQWIEGVGDINGFLNGINHYVEMDGGGSEYLLCAYQGDELKYTGDLYEEYGCGDDAEQNPEDLFPTLWGLQRTSCTKTIGEDEEGTVHGLRSTLMKVKQDMIIDGKQYVLFGEGHNYDSFLLREKGNKVFVYSSLLRKDLVLYDYTLEVGDSLPALYIDWQYHDAFHQPLPYNGEVVDYNKDYDGTILPADTFIVTNISTITLLDGKEHKKWTFNNGMQYVEGIGSYGTSYAENDFYQLIANVPQYSDADSTFLVCVSKDGKLLYQMDDTEMERLGAECLCEVETSYKSQWCDTWNVMWFDGVRFDETASTSKYRLGKDTIIGDYTYSKFTSRTSVRFTSDRKVYVYYEGFDDNDPYTPDLPTGEYLAYDFSAKVGDTLEVFSGIGTYSTYPCVVDDVETAPSPCVVDDVQADLKTFPLIIKLHPLCDVDGEGNMEISSEEITWIEGVGSPEGFLISSLPCGWGGGGTYALLCAYKGDELKYTGPLYEEYGCEYNAGPFNEKLLGTWRVVGGNEIISISDSIIVFIGLTQKYTASATQLTVERLWIPEEESYRWANCNYTLSNDTLWIDNFMPLLVATYPPTFGPITLVKVKHEDLFPTLLGLQRTVCNEYCGDTEDDNSANNTYKQTFDSIFFENDKPYILCNGYLLREEENKILIYSQILNKDLVLYDFTLEVGDSLPALYIDYQQHNDMDWMPYNPGVVDYNIDHGGTIYPADTFIVTNISTVTLLDGKEYKKWTFNNGMEYVEGIGMYGGHRNGDFFRLIQEIIVPCNPGTHLVCVSKNGKLLYQMDDEEMERLGAECICDYDRGPRKDNAKDGQIGGRPTPTQWNQLELDLREMDNGTTILRAETFSYTLEDISQQVNNKTYFQLARQSTKDTATTKSVVGALHFGKDEDNRVYFLRDGVEYGLYDFTAEIGDTVEIFAGINNYPHDSVYTHVVTGKDTLENGACRMLLEVVFPEEIGSDLEQQYLQKVWLAGLGSIDGIVHNAASRATKARSSETQTSVMLCAWRDDDCLYTTDYPDYDSYGCVYNLPTSIKDIETPGGKYQKIIRDGQLYILRDNKLYDVLGTPMN